MPGFMNAQQIAACGFLLLAHEGVLYLRHERALRLLHLPEVLVFTLFEDIQQYRHGNKRSQACECKVAQEPEFAACAIRRGTLGADGQASSAWAVFACSSASCFCCAADTGS